MPASASQTRSSIDLGQSRSKSIVDSTKKLALTTRTQPPRLQHSPSLPNIWFPPHSGPLPPRLNGTEDPLCRPLTPPSRAVDTQLVQSSKTGQGQAPAGSNEPTDEKPMAGLPVPRTQKSGKKGYVDCEQANALLTPPLTPSSSIRTTASHDSTASRPPEKDAPSFGGSLLGCNLDPACTRFLLLSNLSRALDSGLFRSTIVRALAPVTPKSPGNSEVIKGFYFRLQKTHGIVILAFYDLRHAASAITRLGDPGNELLRPYVDPAVPTSDSDAWLTCRYVSAGELKDMIGQSNFIASTNGGFLLYFTYHNGDAQSQDIDRSGTSATTNGHEAPAKREVNVEILRSLLETFGSLYIFVQVNGVSGDDHHQRFQVEYHDVRTAQAARSTLEGRAIYGMTLHTRNLELAQVTSDSLNHQGTTEGNSINPSSQKPPNPQSITNVPPIGQAGQYSHIRERLLPRPEISKSRRQNDVVVHPVINPSSSSAQAATSSPTYFYSTPPLGADIPSQHSYQTSAAESPRKYQPFESFPATTPNLEDGTPVNQVWPGFPMVPNPLNLYPFVAQPECYFFPPPPPQATSPVPAFEMPYGVLPPVAFYHQAMSPLSTAPVASMGLPPPPGYDYDIRSYPTMVNTWLQDHGHSMIGQTQVLPIPAEFWPTEAQSFQPQPPITPAPYPGYHPAPYLPLIPGPGPDDFISPAAASDRRGFQRANPVRPGPSSTSSGGSRGGGLMTSMTREPAAVHERNQLNISRIEDGQDTRSTVMIKNIPNKMTDKDLVAFINNVCPRKIDFLYLRMDFQNGCNVGYAFVNFIYVQDLLKFAKAKLGEKWNMFSSEKVLQMSYANYQGKEALVEKFKNSCIMDEKEAWRPKIFYSEPGPEQGLPQPFPAPTHLRRKERSSHNRGALYVPGVTSNSSSGVYLMQPGPRRQPAGESYGPRKNRSWL